MSFLEQKTEFYQQFEDWCREKRVRDITEEVLLAYFEQKLRKHKGSTLWSNFEGLELLEIFRTYFSLRPSPIEITRFLLRFRNRKCTRQAVGINTTGGEFRILRIILDTASEEHLQHYWPMQELTSQFSKDTVVGDQILLPRDII
jgi:hypothetical protein